MASSQLIQLRGMADRGVRNGHQAVDLPFVAVRSRNASVAVDRVPADGGLRRGLCARSNEAQRRGVVG